MVKTKWLVLLTAMTLLATSCKVSVTPSGGGGRKVYKAGDIALAKIKIGNTEYDNTAEVYVTGPDGATIVGKGNSGVFIEGRTVILSPYVMGKYEVTQQLYQAVMNGNSDGIIANPSLFTGSPATGEEQNYRPVEWVNWYDAVYFCNLLTEKTMTAADKVYTISGITVDSTNHNISSATVTADLTKKGYRLPTEAEWEFAARGGNTSAADWNYLFSGHDTEDGKTDSDEENSGLDAVGWYSDNSDRKTHAVGSKGQNSANALGIYDMSGNVWEWCYDWYDSISTGNVTDPTGAGSGIHHVFRGGSWSRRAGDCSVCRRSWTNGRTNDLGFRVVRSAQ
ncbi:MAG: formylglycine-generating enzyme family protein [Treponema sp.]|nr:formylglycine-generating enzyme family protein [Treponema sp.]